MQLLKNVKSPEMWYSSSATIFCNASIPYSSAGSRLTLLLIQFPVNVPGKTVNDSSSTWTPATYKEDLDRVPEFQAYPSTAQHGQLGCEPVDETSFSFSLCHSQINR